MNVNPHTRFLKCQAHTAQHLISALVESIYGVHTTSHHVGEEECYSSSPQLPLLRRST